MEYNSVKLSFRKFQTVRNKWHFRVGSFDLKLLNRHKCDNNWNFEEDCSSTVENLKKFKFDRLNWYRNFRTTKVAFFNAQSLASIVHVVHDVDQPIIEINRRPSVVVVVVVVVVVAVTTLTRCEISSDCCARNSACIRATGRSVVTRADAQSPWMLLQKEEETSPLRCILECNVELSFVQVHRKRGALSVPGMLRPRGNWHRVHVEARLLP